MSSLTIVASTVARARRVMISVGDVTACTSTADRLLLVQTGDHHADKDIAQRKMHFSPVPRVCAGGRAESAAWPVPALRPRRPPQTAGVARQLGLQHAEGMPVVDVVPARHGDDRQADLARALERQVVHRRCSTDVLEQAHAAATGRSACSRRRYAGLSTTLSPPRTASTAARRIGSGRVGLSELTRIAPSYPAASRSLVP